jgi:carbon storage regulator CsrA
MAGHLALTRKRGEGIFLNDTHIRIEAINGNRVRLYITASEDVNIRRDELPARDIKPRFDKTHCSQCGRDLGPGDCGKSHCDQHRIEEAEAEARNREFNCEDMAVEAAIAERMGL